MNTQTKSPAHAKRLGASIFTTETGNVWFSEPEPPSFLDSFFGCFLVVLATTLVLALLAGLAGFIYQRLF